MGHFCPPGSGSGSATLTEGGAGAAVRRGDGDRARGAGTEGRRFRLQSQPSLPLGHRPAETQVSDC